MCKGTDFWDCVQDATADTLTIGDGDGGKAIAIIVFVYHYISIIYVLNGRKVKP